MFTKVLKIIKMKSLFYFVISIIAIILLIIQEIIGYGILELLITRFWPMILGVVIGVILIWDDCCWIGTIIIIVSILIEILWVRKQLKKKHQKNERI